MFPLTTGDSRQFQTCLLPLLQSTEMSVSIKVHQKIALKHILSLFYTVLQMCSGGS